MSIKGFLDTRYCQFNAYKTAVVVVVWALVWTTG